MVWFKANPNLIIRRIAADFAASTGVLPGDSGPAGVGGALGIAGLAGALGSAGVGGALGIAGLAGALGSAGVGGVLGIAGPAGAIGATGVSGAPTNELEVFGANLLGFHDASHVSVTGAVVDSMTDSYAIAPSFTASGTARPTLTAVDATLSGYPTMSFDASNDAMVATGFALPTPSTTQRIYVAVLMKQNSFTAGRNIVADLTSAFCVIQMGTTAAGRMQQNNGTARNDNTGLGGLGVWGLVEAFFTASEYDCLVAKGRNIYTGASAGSNGPGTSRLLGRNAAGTAFAGFQFREVIHVLNPTLKQLAQYRGLVVAKYGVGVLS